MILAILSSRSHDEASASVMRIPSVHGEKERWNLHAAEKWGQTVAGVQEGAAELPPPPITTEVSGLDLGARARQHLRARRVDCLFSLQEKLRKVDKTRNCNRSQNK